MEPSIQDTRVSWDRIVFAISCVVMLAGAVVIVGWHAHIRAAIQVFPGFIPMQYNTALCFIALGVAGIGVGTRRRLLLLGGGGFATVMGAAVILEYASGVAFGIDTLFFYPWERVLSADPGRMAISTAICCTVTGMSLSILAVRRNAPYAIFGIINSVSVSLALTSLIGYAFQITYVLPFRLGSQMALHTSVLFLVFGIGMLGYAWKYAERGPDGLPNWAAGIGVAFLPMMLVGSSSLTPKQSWGVVPLEALLSISGVLLVTLAIRKLSTARVAYKGLLMIALPLILLLALVELVVHVKDESEAAQEWAMHSAEVIGVSQSLLTRLAETESSVRGFVITGDAVFATSYRKSREIVMLTTARLRTLVRDNPGQTAHAIEIERLAAQRTGDLAEVFRLVGNGNGAAAQKRILGETGFELMRQVGAELEEFTEAEERLGVERRRILGASWQKLSWLLVAGTAAAIQLAGILTLLFSGNISGRLQRVRDNAVNLAAGKALALPLSGRDEIAALDRVFHEMAASLGELTRREKAVIEGTTDAIFVKNLDHRYLMMNRAGADMVGRTVGEIIGARNEDILEAGSARLIREQDNEIIAGGQTKTTEFISTNRAGITRTYLATRGPYRDGQGNIVGTLGISRDITEQKRAESALIESDRRFRDLFYDAPVGYHELDTAGRITCVNTTEQLLLGYSSEEMIGHYFWEFMEEQENVRSAFADRIAGMRSRNIERTFRRKDGTLVEVQIDDHTLNDASGLTIGIRATMQDITERRLIELELEHARDAALESVRLKSEFLANMSHEIRTPMNGVLGMTELLMRTELSRSQRDYAETIQSSADALLRIIDDILDFSKIEAGLLRFEKIDFDVRSAVEATVDLLAERAHVKGLELASLVERDVPTALQGDPGRLRQVLTNLAGNAIKFTERGEVVVVVKRVRDTGSHATLRFEVQDTGIGISAEAQRGLFRAFVQADGSTTRKYGGTGLGLAISKQLVERMGGEIGIESAPGIGSTFWFIAEFEKQSSPAKDAAITASLSGLRVLIVDDNPVNRRILLHQTHSLGMIATEAGSGEQALELLRSEAVSAQGGGQPYDIAILDLMMPQMDGLKLAEAIKADPSIAAVSLILLPSFSQRGHGERARMAGIAAYLQKPVKQSELHRCLAMVMAQPAGDPVTPAQLVTRHSMRDAQAQQKDKVLSSVRILVAEDNLVNQRVALGQLYSLGYHAEAVGNGRELLSALEGGDVDLILMDCQMPEMDGFAATAEIRRREGLRRHTTIIAMTANALDGDTGRCLAAGMDDYLSKPVKSEVLRLKLERWLRLTGPNGNVARSSAPVLREGGRQDEGGEETIDRAQLTSLREIQVEGEIDLVTQIIDLFLSEASASLEDLRAALAKNDDSEIVRVAHLLKGSSSTMGATRLAALSGLMQRNGPHEDRDDLLPRLEAEMELVRTALKAERNAA